MHMTEMKKTELEKLKRITAWNYVKQEIENNKGKTIKKSQILFHLMDVFDIGETTLNKWLSIYARNEVLEVINNDIRIR